MFVELEKLGSQELLEELCPYFGVVWPAAHALCAWMVEHGDARFAGRSFLELGCGLALPSFLAARFGAGVSATDLHPDVPKFLARNLDRNALAQVRFRTLDWRSDTSSSEAETWDWIVASDVLYEKEYAQTVVDFLLKHLSPSGTAVISDPQRPYCEGFEKLLRSAPFVVDKSQRSVPGCAQTCAVFVIRHAI